MRLGASNLGYGHGATPRGQSSLDSDVQFPWTKAQLVCKFPLASSGYRVISLAYRMARYNRLPSLTSGIGQVASSGGGFAVVIKPPASSRIATPAATSLEIVSRQWLHLDRQPTTPNNHPPTRYRKIPSQRKPNLVLRFLNF